MRSQPKNMESHENIPSPRVVVYLGARVRKVDQELRFPLVLPDEGGRPPAVSGGRSRLAAIEALYHEHKTQGAPQDFVVLTTGGKELDGTSRAQAAFDRLVQDKIPAIPIGTEGSTHGNARDVIRYLETHAQQFQGLREVEIVTNDYHMLRAWLIFVMEFYHHFMGQPLHIPEDTITEIDQILRDSEHDATDQNGREQVMRLVAPYLTELPIQIIPQVVEDILPRYPKTKVGARYARLLRANSWVQKTRAKERAGVLKLLRGTYGH